MDPHFWHDKWAQKQIGFHQAEIHRLLVAEWHRVAQGDLAGVFVPLCGKSHDMGWLSEQGHPVVGVELSPVAVAEFFAEATLTPERTQVGALERSEAGGIALFAGDFFALRPSDVAPCRLIYDRAAMVALPPAMRRDYVAHLRRLFPHGARILLVSFDYAQSEMDGPPFAVTEAELRGVYGTVHELSRQDVLAENPSMRQRGVTRLFEVAYLIELPGQ